LKKHVESRACGSEVLRHLGENFKDTREKQRGKNPHPDIQIQKNHQGGGDLVAEEILEGEKPWRKGKI